MNDEQIFLDENEGDDVFKVNVTCAGVQGLEKSQQEGLKNTKKKKKKKSVSLKNMGTT